MTAGYEVVVVGGGIVGAATAFHLARRGAGRVLVCEQGMPPGRGATTRSGGLIRQNHTARCDIELAVRGTRVFQHWSEHVGPEPVYTRTGFAVLVDVRYADHLAKNVAAVNEVGGASSVIEPDTLTELHPGLRVPPDVVVGYEPDGGYADPAAAALSLLAAAGRHGAVVAEGVRVLGLARTGDRLTGVRTSLGVIGADRVVLCAGAWTGPMLADVGIELPLVARRIGVARAWIGAAPGDLPICIDDTFGTYFRPADGGALYFGVPLDPAVDPGTEPEPMTEQAASQAAARLAQRVPGLRAGRLVAARVGVDGYSPDRRPVIGAAGPEGLYLCTAFSGGGVKVAPVVGELVAEELLTATESELLSAYRPQRFAAGELIESEFPYVHM
ncbi:MAG: NAD(P)/FAD-dependent oxidoreductase [Pseudonocardiaceae bacterium]